jgi:hypothetical protein
MLERTEVEIMEIKTILKLAKLAVERYSQTNTQPGFITTENDKKIKVKFSELADALGNLLEKDLVVVRRCKDCDNWTCAPKAKMGSCFPKDFSCGRSPMDFCSYHYVYRSQEMRDIDEAVNRLLSKK